MSERGHSTVDGERSFNIKAPLLALYGVGPRRGGPESRCSWFKGLGVLVASLYDDLEAMIKILEHSHVFNRTHGEVQENYKRKNVLTLLADF